MCELSHAALGITRPELLALRDVRDKIAAGAIRVTMRNIEDMGDGVCPGAHVARRLGIGVDRYVCLGRSDALVPLYNPGSGRKLRGPWLHPGWRAGPQDIVAAIDAFLRGAGPACWDHMGFEAAA